MRNDPDFDRPLAGGFAPRKCQAEATQAVMRDFREGIARCLVSAPTGAGKTEIGFMIASQFERRLLAFPGITLSQQTLARARTRMPDASPDLEQGFHKAAGDADTICATLQSLQSRKRYKKFIGKVDVIMVDECHTHFTPGVNAMLDEFVEHGAKIVGLTATPFVSRKGGLLSWWNRLSYYYTLEQATHDGLLAPVRSVILKCQSYDLSQFKVREGSDFNEIELEGILARESVALEMAGAVAQYYGGEPSIVWAKSIRQATMIHEILTVRYGLKASIVHSKMDDEDREQQLRSFLDGDTKIIVNVACLVMGFDCPQLRKGFLCSPTAVLAKYMQMWGRLTRTLPNVIDNPVWTADQRKAAIAASGKPYATMYDLAGSAECHSLRTSVDVLCPDASDEVKRRVQRRIQEADPNQPPEIDPILKEEIEAEALRKAAVYEAEKARRRDLIVGVTFDARSHDPFAEPAGRSYRPGRRAYMPFGKHKGKPVSAVPTEYLQWVVGLNKKGWIHDACVNEIASRMLRRAN